MESTAKRSDNKAAVTVPELASRLRAVGLTLSESTQGFRAVGLTPPREHAQQQQPGGAR